MRMQRQPKYEKRRVAILSVLVALFLTLMKLVVGLLTQSLGIISEAAHSGLDFLAALMTYFAVRFSGMPADREHPYGHMKFENASALFETLLLLVTCFWIIYEAIERLFFKTVIVHVNIWSYAVVIVAIVLDFALSRILSRVALKTHSQALEADALHFSTDILSSLVVLAGLVFTRVGWPMADAIAALGVSFFVLVVSFRLGWRSINALVDRVPADHVPLAEAAAMTIPEIKRVYDVRVREAGDRHFVDMKVAFDPSASFRVIHTLTDAVEKAVKDAFHNADVVVHAEPVERSTSFLTEQIVSVAEDHGARVHDLAIHETNKGWALTVHLSWPPETSLSAAHDHATMIEAALEKEIPGLASVQTHLESLVDWTDARKDITRKNKKFIETLQKIAMKEHGVRACKDIRILAGKESWWVAVTCTLKSNLSLFKAHQIASRIEQRLRALDPRIVSVNVHTEPQCPKGRRILIRADGG